MTLKFYRARPLADLPFYCHPVWLFLTSWAVMLAAVEFQISESTYPDRWMGIELFAISTGSMLLGYGIARFSNYGKEAKPVSLEYVIDTKRLWQINLGIGLGLLAIVVFNWLTAGPPPFLGFFGVDTLYYLEYGRFKQALQPMAMALAINSFLDESKLRARLGLLFAIGTLLAYIARGSILLVVAEAVILFSIRTSVSRRKLYIRAFAVVFVAMLAMSIVGDFRTAREGFLSYLEIKKEFHEWPFAVLWPISYFSIPLSNMCWIVDRFHYVQPTLSFAYPILPSFWAPINPHDSVLADPHIIDGVHTYLANYFLDFSWVGLVSCNGLIGLLSGFMVNRERISRKFMWSPIILSAIGFIFFWDFFLYLPTLLGLAIQATVQRICIVPIRWESAPTPLPSSAELA